MREVKITQEMLEDSICNLSDLKVIMQKQLYDRNYENKGKTDSEEFARDMDTAIDSMKILLSMLPKYAGTVPAINLLEKAAEELENCYGRETELTGEIRDYLQTIDISEA